MREMTTNDRLGTGKISLSPRLAASLDLARAVAAVYVVIHHVALSHDWRGALSLFKHFGHQAVMLFFLLSGFVIHANERSRVLAGTAGYLRRRILRIYPTLVAAMLISVAVAAADGHFEERFSSGSMFATLLALQDNRFAAPGTLFDPFMDNTPLWSLGYELWFYVLYVPAMMLLRKWGNRGSALIGVTSFASYMLYVIWPQHFLVMTAYFSIWWLGAMIAEAYGEKARWGRTAVIPAVSLAAVVLMAAVPVFFVQAPRDHYPVLQLNHLATALVFAVILFSPIGAAIANLSLRLRRPAAFVASFSYGLYVIHWPLLVQWSGSRSLAGMLGAIAALLVLAIFCDPVLAQLFRRKFSAAAKS